MCAAFAFKAFAFGGDTSATHDGVADNECGLVFFLTGTVEGVGNLHGVASVDFYDVPVPGAVFCGIVLVVHFIDICGELHLVAVKEHYEVAESEVACNASGTLADFFLNAAVGYESVCLV